MNKFNRVYCEVLMKSSLNTDTFTLVLFIDIIYRTFFSTAFIDRLSLF